MKKILITCSIFFAAILTIQAQKFGHINSTQLLLSLPEIKTADGQLQAYQKDLVSKGEKMVKTFEASYNAYLTRMNSGELSKVEMQTMESTLAQEQQAIQKYEVDVQNMIAAKKQELYQPILDKVQSLVDLVGKEMGFTMIFDTSMGGLLFVTDSEDLMPVVKKRLGI